MKSGGINTYKNNAVTTQPPERIVVLLYEGAVRFLKEAVDAIEKDDYTLKGQKIGKAMDIISELDGALDMEVGGDIAQNLRKLYVFMTNHLTKASVNKDPKMIRDVIGQLETLLEGWEHIAA